MTDEYWLAHCPSHQSTGPQPIWLLDILPTATTMNTEQNNGTWSPGVLSQTTLVRGDGLSRHSKHLIRPLPEKESHNRRTCKPIQTRQMLWRRLLR